MKTESIIKEELLNKIGSDLAIYRRQLDQINILDMTVENGKKVRSTLNRVFERLEQAGINFKA
jgi:hypothetical protein